MLRPAAILAATLLLAGCMPSQPIVTPAPEPSSTPIFATDEDALAAATDAYAKYLAAVDESLTSFASDSLNKTSEGKALDSALKLVTKYQDLGNHQSGKISVLFSKPTDLESVLKANSNNSPVQIYVCLDLSGVDVLDRNGNSIVSTDRPDHVYQLVKLAWHTDETSFKVAEEEVWENDC